VTDYWKQKAGVWPRLADVARSVLCVLAMNICSDGSFSVAGRALEKVDLTQAQLSGSLVDGLLIKPLEINDTAVHGLTDSY